MKTTIDALRDKCLLTPEQLAEIEAEWVFGSSVVIPGLLAHIHRLETSLLEAARRGSMTAEALACLFLSYEADEPHVALPDYPLDAEQYYPVRTVSDLRECLGMEHHGDCVKQCSPCLRCHAEMALHKAEWIVSMLEHPAR